MFCLKISVKYKSITANKYLRLQQKREISDVLRLPLKCRIWIVGWYFVYYSNYVVFAEEQGLNTSKISSVDELMCQKWIGALMEVDE